MAAERPLAIDRSFIVCLLVLALGCAPTPARDAAQSPSGLSAPATPNGSPGAPAQSPPGGAVPTQALPGTVPTPATTPGTAAPSANPSAGVTLTVSASRDTIRAGESATFFVTLTNGSSATIFTNPSVTCSGSWDFVVRDATGERVRIDDRDMMGCPSGGPLKRGVPPTDSVSLTLGWDGRAKDRPPGGAHDVPRGNYAIEATAHWSDEQAGRHLSGVRTFTAAARTSITVSSNVPPRSPSAKPPPPAPLPQPPTTNLNPRDDLRRRLDDFTPPPQVVVTTAASHVTIAMQDLRSARAAIMAISAKRLPRDQHRAQIERVLSDFQRQHQGATMRDVDLAVAKLRSAHREAVIADVARRHGIQHPRLISWGPAGGGLGIAGDINGQPVILAGNKLYRGKERPPHFHSR